MRRNGQHTGDRTLDRSYSKKDPEWRYHATRPGRDTLADLFEQRYQDVIDAAWARMCKRYLSDHELF